MSFKALEQLVVGQTTSILGQEVVYTSVEEVVTTINGVFDNAWVEIEGMVSLKPTLRIDLSELSAAPAKGDQVEIEEVNYNVIESRPDGYGGSTLILQKV